MKARLNDLVFRVDGTSILSIATREDCRGLMNDLYDCDVEVIIKKFREKRSLDANAYLWVLLDRLAAVLYRTKEDLYRDYIKRFGIFRDFTLTEDEAKTFRVVWENFGTGWVTEQVDYAQDGDRVVIRAYYGSSRYNTKQMSRLIDAVIEDCKEVGIETMPPERIQALVGEWDGS